jgi:hypothetical protein
MSRPLSPPTPFRPSAGDLLEKTDIGQNIADATGSVTAFDEGVDSPESQVPTVFWESHPERRA